MRILSEAEKAKGVLAASAGNHAQGVALAARHLGIDATVYMPTSAAIPKIEATQGYGARIILEGATLDESIAEAERDAQTSGKTIIHPFDHRDIVLGQATLGLEIADQVPDAQTVLVPTGGGGLLAGVTSGLRLKRGGEVDIFGVQAAGAASYPPSLAQGTPLSLA